MSGVEQVAAIYFQLVELNNKVDLLIAALNNCMRKASEREDDYCIDVNVRNNP